MKICLDPRRVIGTIIWVSGALVALHGIVWGAVFLLGADPQAFWVELFDLDHERNIPTLFSSLLLLGCAALFGVEGLMARRDSEPGGIWHGLGAIFVFLAVDETAGFHEALVPPLRRALRASGLLRPTWVLVYGGALLILGIVCWRWFGRLPGLLRRQFLLAAALYLAG
ncbi:MAG: hypothetical protein H5T70_05685, partial [Chloroflexi bacterium]|nr:hypothetical protein [Chloroflexota bacterium]